jgi:hypothetical protein
MYVCMYVCMYVWVNYVIETCVLETLCSFDVVYV